MTIGREHGRRDRKRRETRNGLAAVALELLAERGFDVAMLMVDFDNERRR